MRKAAWESIRRFPLVFLVVFVAAGQIMALPGEHIQDWRLLAACSLGLPLTIAFHLFVENFPLGRNPAKAIALGVLPLLLLALYAWALPFDPSVAPDYIAHRHFVLIIGLHLVVSFAAFLPVQNREQFWSFNKTLFLRFLATVLFSGTLYLGLALVLAGVGALIGAGDAFYFVIHFHLAVLIFLVFNTWFFLAGVPKLTETSFPAEYPRILRNFCQYVLCPLILASAFVLLLLAAKGLLQDIKSPEDLSYAPLGVLGILAYLLIYPLDGTERWASLFRRIFFALLIPFVGLQFYALIKSVKESGLEESGYYLFILSAWTGAASLYFLISRRAKILWIPVTLAAIAFLSVAGPWSAYSLSKRSQLAGFKTTGEGILPLEWKTAAKTINTLPADRAAEFYSRADKINAFYGLRALAPIFREPPPEGASWNEVERGSGPQTAPAPESGKAVPLGISFYTHGSEDVIDVKGFDRYYRETEVLAPTQGPQDCIFALCAKLLPGENRIALFDKKGEKGRIEVGPFLQRIVDSKKSEMEQRLSEDKQASQVEFDVTRGELLFDFAEARGLKGRFLFWTVFIEKSGKDLQLKNFQANVLLNEGK